MQTIARARQAYSASAGLRSHRAQEADVFRRANAALRQSGAVSNGAQTRALADNGRLWIAVIDLVRDPANQLPEPIRASIISVGLAVQREMSRSEPDIEFLVSVNENIAAGLSAG